MLSLSEAGARGRAEEESDEEDEEDEFEDDGASELMADDEQQLPIEFDQLLNMEVDDAAQRLQEEAEEARQALDREAEEHKAEPEALDSSAKSTHHTTLQSPVLAPTTAPIMHPSRCVYGGCEVHR